MNKAAPTMLDELVARYRIADTQRDREGVLNRLAVDICAAVGRVRRRRAADVMDEEEPLSVPGFDDAEVLVARDAQVLDRAILSQDVDAFAARISVYVAERSPRAEDGFSLLVEYDDVHLIATLTRSVPDRLSRAARIASIALDQRLHEIAQFIAESAAAFRGAAPLIAHYRVEWAVEADHPMTAIAESDSVEARALAAAQQDLRALAAARSSGEPAPLVTEPEVAAARHAIELARSRTTGAESAAEMASAHELLARTARMRGRRGEAYFHVREALALSPERGVTFRRLRKLLEELGRAVVLTLTSGMRPDVAAALHAAGRAGSRTTTWRYHADQRTQVALTTTANDRVVASVEHDGQPAANVVVVLVETDGRGVDSERAVGVTDTDGEIDFGPAGPLARFLSPSSAGTRRVKLVLPPEATPGA